MFLQQQVTQHPKLLEPSLGGGREAGGNQHLKKLIPCIHKLWGHNWMEGFMWSQLTGLYIKRNV